MKNKVCWNKLKSEQLRSGLTDSLIKSRLRNCDITCSDCCVFLLDHLEVRVISWLCCSLRMRHSYIVLADVARWFLASVITLWWAAPPYFFHVWHDDRLRRLVAIILVLSLCAISLQIDTVKILVREGVRICYSVLVNTNFLNNLLCWDGSRRLQASHSLSHDLFLCHLSHFCADHHDIGVQCLSIWSLRLSRLVRYSYM